jgi:lysophospholipase L1-like esterase
MTERVVSDGRGRMSPAVSWGLTAGVVLFSIVLLFLVAEGAIRVRQALKYGAATTVEDLYTVDPRSGLRVPIAGSHYSGRITVNSLGFRGGEIAVPKPPETIRVAFLGASTTWCGEVSSDEKVWPHLVAQGLHAAAPRKRVDHVNGGVPGYTVASSLQNLERRIAPLEPDIIVIYEAANDLSGELREVAAAKGLIESARIPERSWLSRYSLMSELVEKNVRVLLAQQAASRGSNRLTIDPKTLGKDFRNRLSALVKASKQRAKIVALVTFSTQLRAGQDEQQSMRAAVSALYYMPFMTPGSLIQAYGRYNEVIREVAAESGVLLIGDEDSIPGDSAHFTDSVHFTDAGSERMAARVLKALTSDPRVKQLLSS